MDITYDKKSLNIGDIKKEFTHVIRKVHIVDNKIIVLLSISKDDTKTIDNIYAVSEKGDMILAFRKLKAIISKSN